MLIRLYGRAGCHLCQEAAHLLDRLRETADFTVEYIDIDSNPLLQEKFRCQIPVVSFNGGQRVALRITEERLQRALRLAQKREHSNHY
jgi:glutaredoxin